MSCSGLATTWALSPCTVRRPGLPITRLSGSVVLIACVASASGGRDGRAAVLEFPFGTPGKIGLMFGLILGLLGLELLRAPEHAAGGVRSGVGKLRRRLVATRLAEPLVVGISPGGLFESLPDLLADRPIGLGRTRRAVAGDQAAIDGHQPNRYHPRVGTQHQHVGAHAGQGVLVAGAIVA